MDKTLWTRLFKYIKKYKGYIFISFLCALLSTVTNLIAPLLIGHSVDYMIGKGSVNFNSVKKIILLLAALYILGNFFTWLLTYITNRISYKTGNDLRRELFEKIATLPLQFYDTTPHGDTVSRFINDIDSICDGLLQGLSTLLTGIVTIVMATLFMFYLSPIMTVVVLLSAPISFFVARFITKSSQKMFKEQAKSLGKLNGYIEEMIGGQTVVKAFHFESQSLEKFKVLNEELYKSGVKSQFYGSLPNPSTRLVNNITYSVIGVIGSIAAILGKVSIGGISSFLIYSNLFAKPFNEITGVLSQIQAASASCQRIFNILDMPSEDSGTKNHISMDESHGNVTFEKVNFSYLPNQPLIQNLNLKVKSGDRIAIVGQTGAGKTTLVNLLMRFYEVDSGSILIDDKNITAFTRDDLRRNFGMVLQDTWLFEGTILANIAYGKPNTTKEEIIAAAKAANAHSFIRRLPKGYDTLITDAGENLSQGQKQLLTIARVMLVDPPILILDEATSNIDTRTEIHIQKTFLKMMEGRTSFIIAHRLSTIKEADLILVMDKGNIVESGTHEELLKSKGYYANLYNSQFKSA